MSAIVPSREDQDSIGPGEQKWEERFLPPLAALRHLVGSFAASCGLDQDGQTQGVFCPSMC